MGHKSAKDCCCEDPPVVTCNTTGGDFNWTVTGAANAWVRTYCNGNQPTQDPPDTSSTVTLDANGDASGRVSGPLDANCNYVFSDALLGKYKLLNLHVF